MKDMLSHSSHSNGQLPPCMNNRDPRPALPLPEQPWLDAASLSLTSSVVLSSNLLAALEGAPIQCSTLKKGLGEEVLPLFDEGLEDFWSSRQGKSGLEDFWDSVEGQGGRDMVAMQQILSCAEEGVREEQTTVLWNNDLDDEENDQTQYNKTVLFQKDMEESVVISDDEETIPFVLDSDMCLNQSPSLASSLELLPSSQDSDLALLYLPKLACTQEGQFGQEEELACTREGRPGQEEELACTNEGWSSQLPGRGSMRKLEGGQDTGPRKRIYTGY